MFSFPGFLLVPQLHHSSNPEARQLQLRLWKDVFQQSTWHIRKFKACVQHCLASAQVEHTLRYFVELDPTIAVGA